MNHLYPDHFEAYSAGTKPTGLNPYVITVLNEIGIDISNHRSKSVGEFLGQSFDYVVTVCDSAMESCPFFPGAKNYLHKSFPDPSSIRGSEEEILNFTRAVRDDIKKFIVDFFGSMIQKEG